MAKGKRAINLGNNEAKGAMAAPVAPITEEDTMTNVNPTPTHEDISAALTSHAGTSAPAPAQSAHITPPPAPTTPDTEDEDLTKGATNVNAPPQTTQEKRAYYMREIRKLGRAYAGGVLSTLGLAEKLLEGTVNDALGIFEMPTGGKQNDALEMYKLFRMPDRTSKPIDTSTGSFLSAVKKYENVIYLGMNHPADAQEWFGAVRDIYEEKNALPDIKKSLKPFNGTFEAISDIIREQLDRDGKAGGAAPLLDDDEIFNAMLRKEKTYEDDAITALVEAYKKLNLARDGKTPTKGGKGGFSGLKDQQLVDIIQSLQDYAFNDLDPTGQARFKASTAKQKRQRRTIIAPKGTSQAGASIQPNGGSPAAPQMTEEEEAQALGDEQ